MAAHLFSITSLERKKENRAFPQIMLGENEEKGGKFHFLFPSPFLLSDIWNFDLVGGNDMARLERKIGFTTQIFQPKTYCSEETFMAERIEAK